MQKICGLPPVGPILNSFKFVGPWEQKNVILDERWGHKIKLPSKENCMLPREILKLQYVGCGRCEYIVNVHCFPGFYVCKFEILHLWALYNAVGKKQDKARNQCFCSSDISNTSTHFFLY